MNTIKKTRTTHMIDKSIEVDVPVSVAYDQWTQFETFPQFMSGVKEVKEMGRNIFYWWTSIAGVKRQFRTETVRQIPNNLIAWKSIGGEHHTGEVLFESLTDNRAKVSVKIEWVAVDFTEQAGAVFQFDGMQVVQDLKRFKKLVEAPNAVEKDWRRRIAPNAMPGTS